MLKWPMSINRRKVFFTNAPTTIDMNISQEVFDSTFCSVTGDACGGAAPSLSSENTRATSDCMIGAAMTTGTSTDSSVATHFTERTTQYPQQGTGQLNVGDREEVDPSVRGETHERTGRSLILGTLLIIAPR